MIQVRTLVALAALPFIPAYGILLDATNPDSIKAIASTIAGGLVSNYHGNETGHVIGLLDPPYFWWQSGSMFDTLIQYSRLTGDDQYNDIVSQALLFQQGDNHDFMPANQTKDESNDDQSTWASAAMSAAEFKLPESQDTTWVSLAENVFNTQALRWDTATCGGGLRWQLFPFLVGYDYKNSVSNGDFFQLASRLARYTGNTTYSDWATKSFNWTKSIGFIDDDWNVFDGAHVEKNCSDINKIQFSLPAGIFISGAANMYNITTGDAQTMWKGALDGLLNRTLSLFFPNGIATEIACETGGRCDLGQKSYKGLLAQALVDTIQVAPYTSESITPLLTSSAKAAAQACESSICGFVWGTKSTEKLRARQGTNETATEGGLPSQLSALSYVQGLLVNGAASPATEKSGGGNATSTSGSGGGAGAGTQTGSSGTPSPTGNAGVSIGAGNVGLGMLTGLLGSMAWLML